MSRTIVLYNPLSNNGRGAAVLEEPMVLASPRPLAAKDITTIADMGAFLDELDPDAGLLICGGDGTLNRFVNDAQGHRLPQTLEYFASGSGNDFWRDIGKGPDSAPVDLHPYIGHLPRVTVNGQTRLFLNGIGYGIDGYCCEEGDRLRGKSDKPINYTSIAVKGLLYAFHPANATITVDGETRTVARVWLAPTMNGRFFGGGIQAAPGQDRLGDGTVTLMVMFGVGKLRALMTFPKVIRGQHLKYTDRVIAIPGREITVAFDRPTPLQIDGETISGVTSYSVTAG